MNSPSLISRNDVRSALRRAPARSRLFRCGLGVAALAWVGLQAGAALEFPARRREATETNRQEFRVVEERRQWAPERTAIVVCDMWDRHWCRGASERVAQMAPRMNALLNALRQRGVLVIHCPSETLEFYRDTPQRRRAQQAPVIVPKVPLRGWCGRDPEREGPLPIDDSDGGCDDQPPCAQGQPWKRQIAALDIGAPDAISDSAEVLNLLAERQIRQVFILGVHLNMCVLGRPFGIRQLVAQGHQVVLVRDLTDTMYNSRQRPGVNHFTGTELMVEHVEKYWCATVTSADLLGGAGYRFPADRRPRLVALIGEDEYHTWETLPQFANDVLRPRGIALTVLHEGQTEPGRFPGLERALAEADLVCLSVRRRALPHEQLDAFRQYLEQGRPLVALRTSSHAFTLPDNATPGPGRAEWKEFDAAVLGGHYHGHYGAGPAATLTAAPESAGHPILRGLDLSRWVSHGSLYRTTPLANSAQALLLGTLNGQPPEPVAWVHTYGPGRARIFYTSLGHPDDFADPSFRQLLAQGLDWALGREP